LVLAVSEALAPPFAVVAGVELVGATVVDVTLPDEPVPDEPVPNEPLPDESFDAPAVTGAGWATLAGDEPWISWV
jgi:hypothetical protein